MNHSRLDLTELLALEHGDFRFFGFWGFWGNPISQKHLDNFFSLVELHSLSLDLELFPILQFFSEAPRGPQSYNRECAFSTNGDRIWPMACRNWSLLFQGNVGKVNLDVRLGIDHAHFSTKHLTNILNNKMYFYP